MASYLAILFIYAGFSFTIPINLLNGLLIIIFYILIDLLWTFIHNKVWYLPISSVISGCVLGLVSLPDPPLVWVLLLPLLAVISKQLMHFRKIRHVFNPAAFALAIASFFFPAISWWGTSWSLLPLTITALISLFILWKQQRFHVAISFLFSYTFCLSIYLILTGLAVENLLNILSAYLINGTLLFFTTIMLIEPLTSTFPTRRNRIIYGLLVGFLVIILTALLKLTALPHLDPLILGLLSGNLIASLLFLPNKLTKPNEQLK